MNMNMNMDTNIDDYTGVCIQIGLLNTVEMLYLTEPNWRSKIRDQSIVNQIPKFDYDNWMLYAVECDPLSIDVICERYKNANCRLICAHISDYSFAKIQGNTLWNPNNDLWVPAMTLDTFVNNLSLDRIDVLKLDIESDELNVLQSYSFNIKPCYISVECHEQMVEGITNDVKNVLESQEYDIINSFVTNDQRTIELQAILQKRQFE